MLSKLPHFHRAYLVTVQKLQATAVCTILTIGCGWQVDMLMTYIAAFGLRYGNDVIVIRHYDIVGILNLGRRGGGDGWGAAVYCR